MKKIILFLTILAVTTCSVNAQTSYKELIQKIEQSPANEYGVKRIDYGNWNYVPGTRNTWAVYDIRDSSYYLCIAEVVCMPNPAEPNKKPYSRFIKMSNVNTTLEEEIKEILKPLDPEKWH